MVWWSESVPMSYVIRILARSGSPDAGLPRTLARPERSRNMSKSVIEHLSRGVFAFLKPEPGEIRRVIPNSHDVLPEPRSIFLEDESATPLIGFPILLSPQLQVLEDALTGYLQAETEAQCAYLKRQPFDSRAYAARWERYRTLLEKVLEHATTSSPGGDFPAIFWLHHSSAVSRFVQEIPKRLRRADLNLGRDHGDSVKYKVYLRWVDRVVTLNFDVANRIAREVDAGEEALFPSLLATMRDNLLIFTEDYVSPDLSELTSYFNGCLDQDGRDLRQRLAQTEEWNRQQLTVDPLLRAAVTELLEVDLGDDSRSLLTRSGYAGFLSRHPAYDSGSLLSDAQVKVWEGLLVKLKEFELLRALRKMVVPLEKEEGGLVCRDRSMNTTWVGGPSVLRPSPATRPLDFMSPWVVNPLVQRFGLVYDITDFSATISLLGKVEKSALENAFRMSAAFQGKINRLATNLGLRLEKYLGDGAFYSGRQARSMLAMAIHLQRTYPKFVADGFPFDRGLRLALNFGEYRLLPLSEGGPGGQPRYEYFGHGLVELSRLSTGKKTQEIDDFKTYLINNGYPEAVVNKFFAPMQRRSTDLANPEQESRPFFAYINQNGTLINEGIVATEPFISRLGVFPELSYGRLGRRWYIVVELEDELGEPLRIGFRKLGIGKFKGLDPLPVYEVVDGADWEPQQLKDIPSNDLLAVLEQLFAETVTAARKSSAH